LTKNKTRPYRKRARTLTGKKKNKGRNILYAIAGFVIFVFLSILALHYINKNLHRTISGPRITEEELNGSITALDKELNKTISQAGFIKSEIVNKKVYIKSYKDLKWQFKDVKIVTDNSEKLDKFTRSMKSLNVDSAKFDTDRNNSSLVYSINLYGLATHKLNIEYRPRTVQNVPGQNSTTSKDKSDTEKKLSYIGRDQDKSLFRPETKIRSKVVIIVDDIGLNKQSIDNLLDISTKLNFAVLPNLPYSEYAAERASTKGWDVLLHLPMEPKLSSGYTGISAGEGALLTGLPKIDILNMLDKNINSVPYIKGVNNHMGSKFTENAELMDLVLAEVKKKDLFYIDSRTTPNTVGFKEARKLGVKTAQRDVFLDENEASEDLIRKRLDELMKISQKNGTAIGICHPYPNTIKVLRESLHSLETVAEFVSASSIVR